MATAFSIERHAAKPPLERAHEVARGLPTKALRDLASDPAIGMAALARVVAPRRTLDRRLKSGASLSIDESDRLDRFIAALEQATRLLGSRAEAMEWLEAPHHRFEGARPLDLLRTGAGAREVENFFIAARHGMLA